MTTKPIPNDLTIAERHTLCDVLEHCMETNSIANMRYDSATHTYVWSTPESEQDQKNMKALYDKLKPKRVQKSGYILKARMPGEVWTNPLPEEIEQFQLITWEEQE